MYLYCTRVYMYRQDCGVLCSQCIKCVCTCSAAEIGQLKDAVQTKARDLDKANKVSQEGAAKGQAEWIKCTCTCMCMHIVKGVDNGLKVH